jgi:hypothetical protein
MRKALLTTILIIATASTASAGSKIKGVAMLKDLQPTGTTDKHHKHQQFDLFFAAAGKQYTCRTPADKSLKATDFIVGSDMNYELEGNKGKLKNAGGRQVECTIVRVEDLSVTRR